MSDAAIVAAPQNSTLKTTSKPKVAVWLFAIVGFMALAKYLNAPVLLKRTLDWIASLGIRNAEFAQYADHARFVTVEQVREDPVAALAQRHPGHRHPGRGLGEAQLQRAADGLGQVDAVAGIAGRYRRKVLAAAAQMRIGPVDARQVMGEAAAGQHHAAPRLDPLRALRPADQGADHPAVLQQQLAGGGTGVDRDAQIQRRLGQARGQRVAAGHVDAAAVEEQLLDMGGQPFGHVDERGQRLGGVEKVLQVGVR